MRQACLVVVAASFAVLPSPVLGAGLATVIDGVQRHYNSPKTMQLVFEQTYTYQGRPPRSESGVLYLRKPKRMRWDYGNPKGKLFLSDGKHIYFYSPLTNRVEKMPLKESGDMRTPLAFLIGRLDLRRDFREFRTRPEGEDLHISALPRSKKAPFTKVDFLVSPKFRIKRLVIEGQDRSLMEFRFAGEKVNPPLESGLFQFVMPDGAEFVEMTGAEAGND